MNSSNNKDLKIAIPAILTMVPSSQRLSSNRIEYLSKKGRKKVTTSFVCKYLQTTRPYSRFCIVISAKIESKAVKRNLFRRRTYEAIRLHQNILKDSYDFIFIVKPAFLSLEYKEIVQNIIIFFQTIK